MWERTKRRARKDHTCECCHEVIPRGHRYATHFLVYDGTTDYIKRCLRCDAIYDALEAKMKAAKTYGYEEVPDVRLNCGDTYLERWGVDPPPELARLAFMTPAEIQAEDLAKLVVD